jgi:hypothetical protein
MKLFNGTGIVSKPPIDPVVVIEDEKADERRVCFWVEKWFKRLVGRHKSLIGIGRLERDLAVEEVDLGIEVYRRGCARNKREIELLCNVPGEATGVEHCWNLE